MKIGIFALGSRGVGRAVALIERHAQRGRG